MSQAEKKQKVETVSKTIGLISVLDVDNYKVRDYKNPCIYYKRVKVDELPLKEWSILIAACNKPFAYSEKYRSGGTRGNIGSLFDGKHGEGVLWNIVRFKPKDDASSSESEKSSDSEEYEDEEKYETNTFVDSIYDPEQSPKIARDALNDCDLIVEGYYIKWAEEADLFSVLLHWRYIVEGKKQVETFDKELTMVLPERKKALRDELYKQYPFLEGCLSEIKQEEDFF